MMFRGDGLRATVLRTVGAALAAVLLSSCGGGEQVQKFQPTRIIAFGDEASVLIDSGDHNARKYSVNALKDVTTGVLDCKANPLWIQYLGTNYSIVFPQCNPDAVATTSQTLAAPGATVADVAAQIDQFLAEPDSFHGTDLVTILAGTNDVLAQYQLFVAGSLTQDQAVAAVEQAGTNLAAQVNRVANLGGKVLISTIPDVGLTPFALSEEAATPGRAAVLSLLSARFNSKLRVGLVNDGRKIGLLLMDEAVASIVKNVGTTFLDVTHPVCDVTLAPLVQQCTTSTLVLNGSSDAFLWADSLRLSSGGQKTLGALAVARATGNPF